MRLLGVCVLLLLCVCWSYVHGLVVLFCVLYFVFLYMCSNAVVRCLFVCFLCVCFVVVCVSLLLYVLLCCFDMCVLFRVVVRLFKKMR